MTAPDGLRPVRGWACIGLLLGLALQPLLLHAGTPPAKSVEPADEDLLEFLGSVDSDDVGWKQYLARKDTQTPAVKKPPPAPPASSAPGKDGNKDEH
jgi:hypothetical protein